MNLRALFNRLRGNPMSETVEPTPDETNDEPVEAPVVPPNDDDTSEADAAEDDDDEASEGDA